MGTDEATDVRFPRLVATLPPFLSFVGLFFFAEGIRFGGLVDELDRPLKLLAVLIGALLAACVVALLVQARAKHGLWWAAPVAVALLPSFGVMLPERGLHVATLGLWVSAWLLLSVAAAAVGELYSLRRAWNSWARILPVCVLSLASLIITMLFVPRLASFATLACLTLVASVAPAPADKAAEESALLIPVLLAGSMALYVRGILEFDADIRLWAALSAAALVAAAASASARKRPPLAPVLVAAGVCLAAVALHSQSPAHTPVVPLPVGAPSAGPNARDVL